MPSRNSKVLPSNRVPVRYFFSFLQPYRGKTKKDRLRVNCKAFLTWVGDGVGGLLGGDKAYRKLTLKHHPDKMKRRMKVLLKVFIFRKLAFQFPGSPERPTGVLKAVFFWRQNPNCLKVRNARRACSRLFFREKTGPGSYSINTFHLRYVQ